MINDEGVKPIGGVQTLYHYLFRLFYLQASHQIKRQDGLICAAAVKTSDGLVRERDIRKLVLLKASEDTQCDDNNDDPKAQIQNSNKVCVSNKIEYVNTNVSTFSTDDQDLNCGTDNHSDDANCSIVSSIRELAIVPTMAAAPASSSISELATVLMMPVAPSSSISKLANVLMMSAALSPSSINEQATVLMMSAAPTSSLISALATVLKMPAAPTSSLISELATV